MDVIKEKIDSQKLRGGYYTPGGITAFMCKWVITQDTLSVLEPSCGDGNFIEAVIRRYKELGINEAAISDRIKGVEFIREESIKAKKRAKNLGLNPAGIVNSDFFNYLKSNGAQTYNVVVGNPPFIRYQNFPAQHRELAIEMMRKLGLRPNKLTNIWVPFLVVSASLLTPDGKLAMVVPAELFQVKYAAETRVFLSNFFDRMTIITFKKLIFEGIQQEVVLLLGEKNVNRQKGIRVIECKDVDDLNRIDFNKINGSQMKTIDHTTEKWTKYFLSQEEINLLRRLKNDRRVISCGDLMEVDVGLVTGRNEFFIMNDNQVEEWNLKPYTIPVASRSNQLKGIVFTDRDFETNSRTQYPIHLFLPPGGGFENMPAVCKKYIKYGESKGFHTGYKCRIRKQWYITPSLWVPDAYALRQVADYPKIILNETKASSTDTVHRVRFKAGVDSRLLTLSFLNSLTFAFSEITGRSYGGGVMTFEPTEIEELRIPVLKELFIDFDRIDQLIRRRDIDTVLDIVDEALLIQAHGFTREEVRLLREIWRKLSNRRIDRKRK